MANAINTFYNFFQHMKREVALSDRILTRNFNQENINTFREVLRNPRRERDIKLGILTAATGSKASVTATDELEHASTWQDAS